jgi:hypothetical protein
VDGVPATVSYLAPAGHLATARYERRVVAMNRDEALLIKLHDSDRSAAWRAPHTSFRDGAACAGDAAAGGYRESIELRSVAYLR